MKNIMKIALALMALSLFVFSCDNGVTPQAQNISVDVSVGGLSASTAQSKALFADANVATIDISAIDSAAAVTTSTLTKGVDRWTGNITVATSGSTKFIMQARNSSDTLLYYGSYTTNISSNTGVEIPALDTFIVAHIPLAYSEDAIHYWDVTATPAIPNSDWATPVLLSDTDSDGWKDHAFEGATLASFLWRQVGGGQSDNFEGVTSGEYWCYYDAGWQIVTTKPVI